MESPVANEALRRSYPRRRPGNRRSVGRERTAVPAAMRTEMTPILRVLRTADGYARLALRKAATGDSRGMIAELDRISKLTRSLNGRLDRAGLRDCGSNQS